MIAFVALPAFVLANRFAGGGLGWSALAKDHGGPIGGRPIWYAVGALIALLVPLFGWAGAALALAFLAWRTPGWYQALDAGRANQSRLRDLSVMGLRAFAAPPAFVLVAIWRLGVGYGLLLSLALAAGVALSYDAGARLGRRDPVRVAEYLAGCAWGVGAAFVLAA